MKLLIRVDADSEIGAGHVMRCLALAQAWQDAGGEAVFAMATESPDIEGRLKSERMETLHLSAQPGSRQDAAETSALALKLEASWIIVDGYVFDSEYQRAIKELGARLLFIDDYGHCDWYSADMILNQNVYAGESLYERREPHTRLLLGSRYVLIRREFLKWREWKREIADTGRRVLVSMGGADPDNATLTVIRVLQKLEMPDIEARILIGPLNPHRESLEREIKNSSRNIELLTAATDMPELMAWADSAVSAAGSTCWEMAFMGLPFLALILAENQIKVAEELGNRGLAVNLGYYHQNSSRQVADGLYHLLLSTQQRIAMAYLGQKMVDGEGCERVLIPLLGNAIRIRRARESDCKIFWQWANDPEVRSSSFSPASISWDDHVRWFEKKLNDSETAIFIALDFEDNPIGQIRFDLTDEKEAEIDVSIDSDMRAGGYGQTLISTGVERIFRNWNIQSVSALIRAENSRSIKAFERAGFQKVGVKNVKGAEVAHYQRVKKS